MPKVQTLVFSDRSWEWTGLSKLKLAKLFHTFKVGFWYLDITG